MMGRLVSPWQESVVDSCAYGDEDDELEDVTILDSVSLTRAARLVDPSTGQTVGEASITVDGDPCPERVFESTSEKRLWASETDVGSFETWLIQELTG